MKKRELFPLGKAYGDSFCNRQEETKKLLGNIKSGKHTLIIAPRRYGKSSLAEKAIEQSKLPCEKINFHLCTSEEDVSNMVLDSVIKLIGKSIGQIEKLMTSIKKYIKNLEPLISFGGKHAALQLIPKNNPNYSLIISESLLLLEKLLREKNKKAIIFLDEFQEIVKINKERGLEGAFRTAAQEMKNVSLIFSGSIRSLLVSMFEDENRPLYKLCRKIKLDRITESDYEKHIQKIAIDTWGHPLEKNVFRKIMELSNRHSYYVNYLCDMIWASCDRLPKLINIQNAWSEVIVEEWSDALKELSDLPIGQRRLLKYIANHDVKTLQSQESSLHLSMPPSSIATASSALIEKDYIEQDENGYYQIINPLLLAVLQGNKINH